MNGQCGPQDSRPGEVAEQQATAERCSRYVNPLDQLTRGCVKVKPSDGIEADNSVCGIVQRQARTGYALQHIDDSEKESDDRKEPVDRSVIGIEMHMVEH